MAHYASAPVLPSIPDNASVGNDGAEAGGAPPARHGGGSRRSRQASFEVGGDEEAGGHGTGGGQSRTSRDTSTGSLNWFNGLMGARNGDDSDKSRQSLPHAKGDALTSLLPQHRRIYSAPVLPHEFVDRRKPPRWRRGASLRQNMSSTFSLPVQATPPSQQYRKYHLTDGEPEESQFSFFVAVCFTINYIMGSGFLGVPQSFSASGIILGTALMIFATAVCDVTKNWLLEAMARAEVVAKVKLLGREASTRSAATLRLARGDLGSQAGSGLLPAPATATGANSSRSMVSAGSGSNAGVSSTNLAARKAALQAAGPGATRFGNAEQPVWEVTSRKFEITEMMDMFLGRKWRTFYVILLWVYSAGALWAYSTVFAASFSANVPIFFLNDGDTCNIETDPGCYANYRIWLGVFSLFVVPLSCLDLREQQALQVTMAAGRFIVIGVLVGTTLSSFDCDGTAFAGYTNQISTPTFAAVAGLKIVIPVAVYAQLFHASIPVISQPVKDKTQLSRIFSTAFAVTLSFYVTIGIIIALYFGTRTQSQCNLMWEQYVGCIAHGGSLTAPWWARILSIYALIFPACDVASAYPLAAITLGNNLMSAWASDKVAMVSRYRHFRLLFRLVAAVPPLAGAFFVSNLDTILSFAGILGFFIAFFVPAALQHYSAVKCEELFPGASTRTMFRHIAEFKGLLWAIVLIMAGLMAYVFVGVVQAAVDGTQV